MQKFALLSFLIAKMLSDDYTDDLEIDSRHLVSGSAILGIYKERTFFLDKEFILLFFAIFLHPKNIGKRRFKMGIVICR